MTGETGQSPIEIERAVALATAYIRQHPGVSSRNLAAWNPMVFVHFRNHIPYRQVEHRDGWYLKDAPGEPDAVSSPDLWASPKVLERLRAIKAELHRVIDRVDDDFAPFDALSQITRLISDLEAPKA